MFLAEKPRLTWGKIVVKLAYLPISAYNYFSPNLPFSKFCAIKVHRHDVSKQSGVSGDRVQFLLAILFQTKTRG